MKEVSKTWNKGEVIQQPLGPLCRVTDGARCAASCFSASRLLRMMVAASRGSEQDVTEMAHEGSQSTGMECSPVRSKQPAGAGIPLPQWVWCRQMRLWLYTAGHSSSWLRLSMLSQCFACSAKDPKCAFSPRDRSTLGSIHARKGAGSSRTWSASGSAGATALDIYAKGPEHTSSIAAG